MAGEGCNERGNPKPLGQCPKPPRVTDEGWEQLAPRRASPWEKPGSGGAAAAGLGPGEEPDAAHQALATELSFLQLPPPEPICLEPPPRARCSAPRREQQTDSSGTELPGTPPPAPRWVPLRQGRKSSAILGGRVIVSDSSSQPCSDLFTGAGFYQSQEGQRLRQTGPVLPGTCRAVGLAHAAGLTTLTESQNHLTALRGATWAN